MSVEKWVRPNVLSMAGYQPGEQPKAGEKVIKLNTNENPYGPPPAVMQAMAEALTDDTMRRYPAPDAYAVREAAARALGHGLTPQQVIVGNGSDDLLTMILRTFIDPNDLVATMDPTYTLYAPLTTIQGGRYTEVAWDAGDNLPLEKLVALKAKVIFVTRPNAPTGHVIPLQDVAELCRRTLDQGVVILDEAYGDFAEDHGLPLLKDHSNLIVTRSASKSLSLAGMRIGFGFMAQELALQMHKVRDSYNVDHVAQMAALAAFNNLHAYAPRIAEICKQRQESHQALTARGFTVRPSQANFLLAKIPAGPLDGPGWLAALKQRRILVRYFAKDPQLAGWLRISIGTTEEMAALMQAIDEIMLSN
uniref:Histidinol-phosphate aminotransferase n=1 Tax=Magnetococcus massalia (strain MO-1) TaxID=451514 RepID=A0A1S7LKM6_MAGMO|nr:Histidinol-phosphate aminotransferase 1 [Candidatus Magnetococcus massalia]